MGANRKQSRRKAEEHKESETRGKRRHGGSKHVEAWCAVGLYSANLLAHHLTEVRPAAYEVPEQHSFLKLVDVQPPLVVVTTGNTTTTSNF